MSSHRTPCRSISSPLGHSHCGKGGHYALVNCPKLKNDMEGCSSSSGQKINIAKEILHPDWNQDKTDNDFSLVVLESAVDMDGVRLVTLNDDTNFPDRGKEVTVTVRDPSAGRASSRLPFLTNRNRFARRRRRASATWNAPTAPWSSRRS
jgi:hypothetical protein